MDKSKESLIHLIHKIYSDHITTIERSRQRFLRNIIVADNAFMERRRRRIKALHQKKKNTTKRSRKLLYSSEWWLNVVASNYTDKAFLDNIRMGQETFLYIVDRLRDALKPSEKAFLTCLSVEKLVAIALFKLASCSEYRAIATIFGVHKTTVQRTLYKVLNAINSILLEEEIYMPKEMEEIERVTEEFEKKCNFPSVLGCLTSTHIPIPMPSIGHQSYINSNNWPSIVLQVVVDPFLCFRNIYIKHPGSVYDTRVLKESDLYKNHDELIAQYEINSVPSVLLGNTSYPLLTWLIKEYTPPETAEEKCFNAYLNSGRIVTEQAIARLKARWRCLCKTINVKPEFIPQLITACCILHNLLERNNEKFNQSWLDEAEADQESFPQPSKITWPDVCVDGEAVREKIKTYLNGVED